MKLIRGCDKGFFANCNDVARQISQCLLHNESWHIVWGEEMPYYDKDIGDNAWEYYFKQLYPYNEINHVVSGCVDLVHSHGSFRNTMNFLYSNFFHLNDKTVEYLAPFTDILTTNKTLGVHIRRTDKFLVGQFGTPPSQAPVDLDLFKYEIDAVIDNYDKLYVATDCITALEYMQKNYTNKIVFNTECTRGEGTNSIHNNYKDISGYKKGLDVLCDAYNLSKCKHLIRSTSNVSIAALYINNEMTYLNINDKYLNDNDGLL